MTQIQIQATRNYPHPPGRLWPVVADLGRYADHATGLATTEIIAGSGRGAVRRCETVKGDDWVEEVVAWTEGREYVINVDTSTYPQPLRAMFREFRGTWLVEPLDGGSRVTVRFDGDVRGGPIAAALVRRIARKNAKDLEATLDSYGRATASLGDD